MISIDYRLVQGCPSTDREITADDLDYRYFLGDVCLAVDGTVIDARWGWVPIVHFVTLLLIAVGDLFRGQTHAEISFTENEAVICFDRRGLDIRVTATFTTTAAQCNLNELRNVSVQFATQFFDDIIQQRPSLLGAKAIDERLHLIGEVSRLKVS